MVQMAHTTDNAPALARQPSELLLTESLLWKQELLASLHSPQRLWGRSLGW